MKKTEALQKMKSAMMYASMSSDTQKQYISWVNKYLLFIEKGGFPKEATSKEKFFAFNDYLSSKNPQPSLSSRKQAYFAVLYFYKSVFGKDMSGIKPPTGKRVARTFNVLSKDQLKILFGNLSREDGLIARLLYGTGMRIGEGISLRIKDVDFDHKLIYVQEGKGDKPRRVDLPDVLVPALEDQIKRARSVYKYDKDHNMTGVFMPHLLDKKNPSLAHSFEWFWLFPNVSYGIDPETDIRRRHHVYDWSIQRSFKIAREKAGLPVYTTPHILRHCYATHYLQKVLVDLPKIPNVAEFARDLLRRKMGHVDAKTTDIYIHLAMPKNMVIDHSPLSDME